MEQNKQKDKRNGKLRFRLTNDYLFKVVFQRDKELLRKLLAALLGISEAAITDIDVINTIIPGESVDDKTVMLDIRLILNGRKIINIEMQVNNEHNWQKRSVFYMCRMFTRLESGQVYDDALPVHQIGIIDFELEGVEPALFSSYRLINERNNEIYSEDIKLSILNLRHIDLATDEDKLRKLDTWAKIFKAETWEDLQMIANKEDFGFVEKISDSIYAMTEDAMIREQCYLREERTILERRKQEKLEAYEKQIAEDKKKLKENKKQLAESKKQLATNKKQLTENKKQLAENEKQIAELKERLSKYEDV